MDPRLNITDRDHTTFMRQRAASYRQMHGWSEDAQKAMTENPKYFVWWYTAKSIALVIAGGAAIYFYCKWKQVRKNPAREYRIGKTWYKVATKKKRR